MVPQQKPEAVDIRLAFGWFREPTSSTPAIVDMLSVPQIAFWLWVWAKTGHTFVRSLNHAVRHSRLNQFVVVMGGSHSTSIATIAQRNASRESTCIGRAIRKAAIERKYGRDLHRSVGRDVPCKTRCDEVCVVDERIQHVCDQQVIVSRRPSMRFAPQWFRRIPMASACGGSALSATARAVR